MKKLLCLSNANNATLLKIPKQAGIITSILLAFSPVMSANGNPVAEPEIVVQVSQQSSTVKGVVEDDMGPVVGATVVVKGTTNGTVTDMDGNFSLPGVKEVAYWSFRMSVISLRKLLTPDNLLSGFS